MSEPKDPATYRDFDELMDRLQDIVKTVRSKDSTIEESLDLLEEGITLGLRATDLVEKPTFTEREQQEVRKRSQSSHSAQTTPKSRASATPSPESEHVSITPTSSDS